MTISPVASIDRAIHMLRMARDILVYVNAPRAADKVRRAIKSAEGARRHAEMAPLREVRQQQKDT